MSHNKASHLYSRNHYILLNQLVKNEVLLDYPESMNGLEKHDPILEAKAPELKNSRAFYSLVTFQSRPSFKSNNNNQWPRTHNPSVRGSSPCGPTKNKPLQTFICRGFSLYTNLRLVLRIKTNHAT